MTPLRRVIENDFFENRFYSGRSAGRIDIPMGILLDGRQEERMDPVLRHSAAEKREDELQ